MVAWITDAQEMGDHIFIDVSASDDASRSPASGAVLLQTPQVRALLGAVGSRAVVAPKGFGKTLVLRAKRRQLESQRYQCLPTGVVIDRYEAGLPWFNEGTSALLRDVNLWSELWSIAFATAALKAQFMNDAERQSITTYLQGQESFAALRDVFDDPIVNRPMQIIARCLTILKGKAHHALSTALTPILGVYAQLHKKIAIFVDNIDEYMESTVGNADPSDIRHIETKRAHWKASQIGALKALRRLDGLNPHVKIFISLRAEAYHAAISEEPQFQNLSIYCEKLEYSIEDLRKIIHLNISKEPGVNLVSPDEPLPMPRFLGIGATHVMNFATGDPEDVVSYWLRHATLRPREIAEIGRAISVIAPARREPQIVRKAISYTASQRLRNMFAELKLFTGNLDLDLLARLVPSNVLSTDQLAEIDQRYVKELAARGGSAENGPNDVFSILYAIGLLGVIQRDRDRPTRLVQHFERFGGVHIGAQRFPMAEKYLLHPTLCDFISCSNPDILFNLDRDNAIGPEREWRDPSGQRYVAIGDVVGYRQSIANNSARSDDFSQFLDRTVSAFSDQMDAIEANRGDSVTLVDRSPTRLLRCVAHIMREISASRFARPMRFGCHAGEVVRVVGDNGATRLEFASIAAVAARLEPLAHAGDVLVTGAVRDGVLAREPLDAARFERLGSDYLPDREWIDDAVNIAKPRETPEAHALWRLRK